MNIFYTGIDSAVGNELSRLGAKPLACDITNMSSVVSSIESVVKPDVIINLAGISDPDFCEIKENTNVTINTNVRGAYYLSLAGEQLGIPVVLISTDHIFDGKKGPYKENSKLTIPVNFYGNTKLAMEAVGDQFANVKIVRTSYLFSYKRTFQSPLDNRGIPTFYTRSFMYLPHFAKSLYEYANRFTEMPKILHLSGSETISWYEFLLSAATVFGWDKNNIKPRRRELKDLGANRPRKAGLDTRLSMKLGFPIFDAISGLNQMKQDKIIGELYGA